MGGAVFPSCCLAWDQTVVEVMKILVPSFKRSHAHTAILSAPNPAAGHCWPTPPLETPGHSRASLRQSLVGSLLLSPGSWCTQGFVCDLQKEAGQRPTVLPRERTGHSKHPLPTIQEKILHMDITRWSIPKSNWLYSLQPKMEKLYTVSKNKRSWLWLRSWILYCQIHS